MVSLAGFCEPESIVGAGGSVAGAEVPVHCGSPMELGTPTAGRLATGYSFDPPVEPVRLPPVWRCGCGFQLDAWDSTYLAGYPTVTDPVSARTP